MTGRGKLPADGARQGKGRTGPPPQPAYAVPERLVRLYDHARIGLAILDPRARILDANAGLADLLGEPREALHHKSITQFILPRYHTVLHALLRNLVASGSKADPQRHDVELVLVRQDGHHLPVDAIGSALTDPGNPARVHLTIVEASERRHRDAALRDSEQLHRRGIVDSPFPVLIYAEDGEILEVNQAWMTLSGYAREELRTIEEWTARAYGNKGQQVKAYIDGLFDINHAVEEGDYVIRTKSGDQRTWAFASAPMGRLADGRRVVLSTASDVTTQRKTEAMAYLHSAALQATANAIVITDLQGTITWVNASFSALTGFTSAEAVGRNPRELVRSGRHDERFYRKMWATILAGEVWVGELINRRKDGTLYPESQTITPVRNAEGAITHFVAVKQDLTSTRQLQDQLLQSQKMEVVGRLASGVAHDFNNILTLINGTSDILLEHLDADHAVRSDIAQIHDAGRRATTLARQLLAFSRMQVTTPEVIHLGTVVSGMQRMLQSTLGSDIRLDVQVSANHSGMLIDQVQAEQVLMNLCVNARDAMPQGGSLALHVTDVLVDRTAGGAPASLGAGPHVLLEVTDTGTGMDAITLTRLFEPFFTTKEFGRGTGLGLSTVHDIVVAAHGAIEVRSTLGQGSTFRVWFPAAARPAAPSPAGTDFATLAPTGDERILIVEDEAAIGQLARRVLEKIGYTTMVAQSGREALELLATCECAVDLLFTDMVMPEMTGHQLATAARQHHPGIRVLYTSGHSHDHYVQGGVLAPGTAFLHKPYGVLELARRVREALDKKAVEG